jgi:hypothetical protein
MWVDFSVRFQTPSSSRFCFTRPRQRLGRALPSARQPHGARSVHFASYFDLTIADRRTKMMQAAPYVSVCTVATGLLTPALAHASITARDGVHAGHSTRLPASKGRARGAQMGKVCDSGAWFGRIALRTSRRRLVRVAFFCLDFEGNTSPCKQRPIDGATATDG